MERWLGKVAIVTGGNAGIGASIAESLARQGLRVVALDKTLDNLARLGASLKATKAKIHPMQCDVAKEEDIMKAFEWTEKELGSIDVLVNNAGVLVTEPIIDGSTENYRRVMGVNIIGAAICSREAIRRMRKQSTQGHIFNINSVGGHFAHTVRWPNSMYIPSKYAMNAMSITMRKELTAAKINVKITSISPGTVITDMLDKLCLGPTTLAKNHLLAKSDIVDAVNYALSSPPHSEVHELIIMPHQFEILD